MVSALLAVLEVPVATVMLNSGSGAGGDGGNGGSGSPGGPGGPGGQGSTSDGDLRWLRQ